MKIEKKSSLIDLLSSVQVICLAAGLIAGLFWTKSSIRRIVRKQIMDDNQAFAIQMSRLIERSGIATIQYGTHDWDDLQTLVENAELPNDGYMCIADVNTGNLACHPELRANPSLRYYSVCDGTISIDGVPTTIRSHLKTLGDKHDGTFRGVAGDGDQTEVLAVSVLPEIGGVLLVHQNEAGIRQATHQLLIPLGGIALLIGVGLIWCTKKASVRILTCYEDRIAEINAGLEQTVRDRTRALTKTRDAVIFGLAKLSESRDNDTGEHLDRIRTYVTILTRHLAKIIPVEEQLIRDIGLASSLHDIGKVGVEDQVLLKPGRLTEDERRLIEVHPVVGEECLEAIESHLGEDNFLNLAREICASHHEKWDGSGYPKGLAGTEIPLSARIVAIADVYDALRSQRPYKKPMDHQVAREIILDGKGSHFDPDIVEAFLLAEDEFREFSETQAKPPGVNNPPVSETREPMALSLSE